LGESPVGPLLAVEAVQETQADRGVDVAEQADRAGEDQLQVGAELIGDRDPVGDEILAGPAGLPQRDGLWAVRDQRPEPGPVGTQRVGQHVRVEPVVLVAGRPVSAAKVPDLIRANHHHGEPGLQQGVDDGAVRSFDGHFADAELAQPTSHGK